MKILVVICTGFVSWGGLTTVAMNYYRAMDKTDLNIDFASNNEIEPILAQELKRNGSLYIQLPPRKKIFSYQKKLYEILQNYDVIHIHGNSATMSLELFPAVMRKVSKRIVHCHTTKPTAKILSALLHPFFLKMYTHSIAVSEEAGNWLFGKNNFLILNNAIQLNKYKFDISERNIVRDEIGVSNDTIILGHVGKIYEPKNHLFLIKVFDEVRKRMPNAFLLLVGDGPMRSEVYKFVKAKKLENSVLFVGMVSNAAKWMQAMDCFVFPSLWEGFPLAYTEAQANGLKCYAASSITKSAQIISTAEQIELKKGEKYWADIISHNSIERLKFEIVKEAFQRKNLDIDQESKKLRTLYLKE